MRAGVSQRNGPPRRVVVTGMGVVTSLGQSVPSLWDAVLAGRSGVRWIQSFDSRSLPVRVASEVDLDSVAVDAPAELVPLLSRSARFGISALGSAWDDAGLKPAALDMRRTGVSIGASSFPLLEQTAEDSVDIIRGGTCNADVALALARKYPEILAQRDIPMVGSLLATCKGARGTCTTVQTACSSASQALGEAFFAIQRGQADVMISGGTDGMISIFCLVGFTLLGALSRNEDPARASRPFDAKRDGFVLGEGAGIVILEELDHALRRGARIHAELLGYGASSDGYRLTDVHPNGQGAVDCMRAALASAGLAPDQVGYINAHGTSTIQNDRVETLAIKRVFGEYTQHVPVSSTKSQLGHLVCAAGGVEFVLTAMALKTGVLPPTINLENPDPLCDLDYVPREPRRADVRVAISNSFGFGGENATLVLRRWDEEALESTRRAPVSTAGTT